MLAKICEILADDTAGESVLQVREERSAGEEGEDFVLHEIREDIGGEKAVNIILDAVG